MKSILYILPDADHCLTVIKEYSVFKMMIQTPVIQIDRTHRSKTVITDRTFTVNETRPELIGYNLQKEKGKQ